MSEPKNKLDWSKLEGYFDEPIAPPIENKKAMGFNIPLQPKQRKKLPVNTFILSVIALALALLVIAIPFAYASFVVMRLQVAVSDNATIQTDLTIVGPSTYSFGPGPRNDGGYHVVLPVQNKSKKATNSFTLFIRARKQGRSLADYNCTSEVKVPGGIEPRETVDCQAIVHYNSIGGLDFQFTDRVLEVSLDGVKWAESKLVD